MRELIGECQACNRYVFCENGFFDGDMIDGYLLCPECAEEQEQESKSSQSD